MSIRLEDHLSSLVAKRRQLSDLRREWECRRREPSLQYTCQIYEVDQEMRKVLDLLEREG